MYLILAVVILREYMHMMIKIPMKLKYSMEENALVFQRTYNNHMAYTF